MNLWKRFFFSSFELGFKIRVLDLAGLVRRRDATEAPHLIFGG